MRLAVISDIHGNLAALEATLEALEREEVDLLVVAGDIVNGAPDSRECWRLVGELGCPIVRGNHERYLYAMGTPHELPEWRDERFEMVRWAARRFSRAELDRMAALPLCFHPPEAPEVLVVHSSARADNLDVHPWTSEEELTRLFGEGSARLVLRGHNHLPLRRDWAGGTIVTGGSVGLALDGYPCAQYTVAERRGGDWRVEHRCIDYDVEATVARFREEGYLEEAGPMARLLLREVATGSHQMSPFLRYWRERPELGGLGEAVDSFLNAY